MIVLPIFKGCLTLSECVVELKSNSFKVYRDAQASKTCPMSFLSDPPRTLLPRCIYDGTRFVFRIMIMILYRAHAIGAHNYPKTGGMIICSNHQSNLDPVVIGSTCPRRLNYLGKKSLFRLKPMGWYLSKLDCVPIDREGVGVAGMKETLRRLKRGESVLLFPEGERSPTGDLLPLMTGFISLCRRAKLPLVPVALDGAYQAWPRHRKFPRLGRVVVVVGEPISAEDIAGMDNDQLVEELSGRIAGCFYRARNLRNKGQISRPATLREPLRPE